MKSFDPTKLVYQDHAAVHISRKEADQAAYKLRIACVELEVTEGQGL